MKTFVEFTDADGHEVRVQWSSAATRPKARVYLSRAETPSMSMVDACLHLSEPQVRMLVAGLDEWLHDVEDE